MNTHPTTTEDELYNQQYDQWMAQEQEHAEAEYERWVDETFPGWCDDEGIVTPTSADRDRYKDEMIEDQISRAEAQAEGW